MDEGFRESDVNVVASNVRGTYAGTGPGASTTTGLAGTSAATGMSGVTGTGTTGDYARTSDDYARTSDVTERGTLTAIRNVTV